MWGHSQGHPNLPTLLLLLRCLLWHVMQLQEDTAPNQQMQQAQLGEKKVISVKNRSLDSCPTWHRLALALVTASQIVGVFSQIKAELSI